MTASKQADKATTVETPGGIRIHHREHAERYADAALPLQSSLDSRRGVLLTSSFEYPGRYTRWDIGFVDPPLVFTTRGRAFSFDALNARGALLLTADREARTEAIFLNAALGDLEKSGWESLLRKRLEVLGSK